MMINSSPEYAITKPGMSHHLSRKRDKPLRTYGRKAASTPEPRSEPPAKRQRLERDVEINGKENLQMESRQLANKGRPESSTNSDKPSRCLTGTEATPRPSILQYFKPLPTELQPDHLDKKKIDVQDEPTPVHSRVTRSRKRPRLLRIRATSPASEESEYTASLSSRDETDSNMSSPVRKRPSLHEVGEDLLNRGRTDAASSLGARTRSKRSPTVQTTLNISSKAAFAECRVCDTVWNPLYPDDVKYHEKRHKSVVRRAQKVDIL